MKKEKKTTFKKFPEYVPAIANTFRMQINVGGKPFNRKRDRKDCEPNIVFDRAVNMIWSSQPVPNENETTPFSDLHK